MSPQKSKKSASASSDGQVSESDKDLSSNKSSYKPVVNEDDLYRNTTQYRFWSFTEESLSKKRAKVNQKGKSAVFDHIKRLVDQQSSSSSNNSPDSTDLASSFTPLFNYTFEQACSSVEIVTPEEELKEVNYYVSILNKLCKSVLKLPIQARYTAISFFKKFYLSNSVMQIHPKQVLTTCIFLACKSENCFISPNTLADLIGAKKRNNSTNSSANSSNRDAILSLEFPLLTSLKFSLMCHHPHSPLQGFLYDFQTILIHKNKQGVVVIRSDKHGNKRKVRVKYTKQRMLDCFKSAMNMVENLMQSSDLMFFYTPSQIALACLYLGDEELTESYLVYKFGSSDGDSASNTEAKEDHKKEGNDNEENTDPVSNNLSQKDATGNSKNKDADNNSEKENTGSKLEKKEKISGQQSEKSNDIGQANQQRKYPLAESENTEKNGTGSSQKEGGSTGIQDSGTENGKSEKWSKENIDKKLLKILKKCIKDMQEKSHEIPDISVAKVIDKKVHYCIHPDKLLKRKMQDDELNNGKKVKIG